jgi:drug/metabolite transporter (DMT)-like permease
VALWIPITVLAAFLQNLRSALQRNLLARLDTGGATYVRFLYAVPFALGYLAALSHWRSVSVPEVNAAFLGYALAGGLFQIFATLLLIRSFTVGTFALGTAYSKTETVQAVVFGLLLLGDTVGTLGLSGILVSGWGVLLMTGPLRGAQSQWRSALLGIASGACFALSVTGYRGAALALTSGDYLIKASLTLVVATTWQALIMGVYLLWRNRPVLLGCLRHWRSAWWVGASGMAASAAWFTALTLERAAYVRAVGQIELLFTFLASVIVFRERARGRDMIGASLMVLGIGLLLAADG